MVSPPGRFLPRITRDCAKRWDGNGCDWILIMGGTNDIGARAEAEAVYEGLSKESTFLFFFEICLWSVFMGMLWGTNQRNKQY